MFSNSLILLYASSSLTGYLLWFLKELTNISSGAISLLNIIDIVLAAAILVGIVVMGFSFRRS